MTEQRQQNKVYRKVIFHITNKDVKQIDSVPFSSAGQLDGTYGFDEIVMGGQFDALNDGCVNAERVYNDALDVLWSKNEHVFEFNGHKFFCTVIED